MPPPAPAPDPAALAAAAASATDNAGAAGGCGEAAMEADAAAEVGTAAGAAGGESADVDAAASAAPPPPPPPRTVAELLEREAAATRVQAAARGKRSRKGKRVTGAAEQSSPVPTVAAATPVAVASTKPADTPAGAADAPPNADSNNNAAATTADPTTTAARPQMSTKEVAAMQLLVLMRDQREGALGRRGAFGNSSKGLHKSLPDILDVLAHATEESAERVGAALRKLADGVARVPGSEEDQLLATLDEAGCLAAVVCRRRDRNRGRSRRSLGCATRRHCSLPALTAASLIRPMAGARDQYFTAGRGPSSASCSGPCRAG